MASDNDRDGFSETYREETKEEKEEEEREDPSGPVLVADRHRRDSVALG